MWGLSADNFGRREIVAEGGGDGKKTEGKGMGRGHTFFDQQEGMILKRAFA